MLLITRRQNESVVINGNIELTIMEIRGGRVKIGFEFPTGNTVFRKELYLKIQEENRSAAAGGSGEGLSDVLKALADKSQQKTNK